jgi:hypothetical protein
MSIDSTTNDRPKIVYQTPTLIELGDVRDITLGGSPGLGDTGNPGAEKLV